MRASPRTKASSVRARAPDLDAILEALVYLYGESRRVTRAVAEQYGLTGSQLLVLKMLEPSGRLSLSDLSDRIRAKNSTVTGIIDRMERDGVVARRRSEEDRRIVHIELTAEGKRRAAKARIDPMRLFRLILEELSPRDAADLERVVTRLAARAKELLADPSVRATAVTSAARSPGAVSGPVRRGSPRPGVAR